MARRVLISIGLIITVAAILVGNMPDSALTARLSQWAQPYLTATGLNQIWGVFAPPRRFAAYVDGHIDYSDGTSSVQHVPSDPGLGAYSDYRWLKYEESIRPDTANWLWPAYAEYLANRARADGRNPVRVTVIRRWADSLPPGPGPERGPWHEFTMYVLDVAGAR
jgi:hypothetical protein